MYDFLGIVYLVLAIVTCGFFVLSTAMAIKKNGVVSKFKLFYSVFSFVLVFAIFLTGNIYNANSINYEVLFSSTKQALKIFGYEFNFPSLAGLIAINPIYNVIGIIIYALVVVTEGYGIVVLFGTYMKNYFSVISLISRNCDIVLGISDDSIAYAKENKNCVIWENGIDGKTFSSLLVNNIFSINREFSTKNLIRLLKKGEHHIIVFKDSYKNLPKVISIFEATNEKKLSILYLHIEASLDEMAIIRNKYISKVKETSNSFVTSFSKHELIARDFVMKNPISKDIPRSFYNDNLTIKEDKNINVVFLGFGMVNKELFRMISSQYQFASLSDGNLISHPVNYYIYDKSQNSLNSEYISKNYEHDIIFENSSFPKPESICNVMNLKAIDVNSIEARNHFREFVKENNYTYFIVSLNKDFSDASFAEELKYVLGENENYKIFVRVKENVSDLKTETSNKISYFGEYKECLTHNFIINERLINFSKAINGEYNKTALDKLDNIREWEKRSLIDQYSNISSALSIPFKLGLLGLSLKDNIEENAMTKEDFDKYLPENDRDDIDFYFEHNRINVLAFIEHSRWNAFYIYSNYRPLQISEFRFVLKQIGKDDNGKPIMKKDLSHKSDERKMHACLTTYLGLKNLIEKKFELIQNELNADPDGTINKDMKSLYSLFAYDYMILNNLYNNVVSAGYTISVE